MQKITAVVIIVLLLLSGVAFLRNAAYEQARQRDAAATNSVLLNQITSLQARNAQLEARNESILYQNSRRDNRTVNSIARWHVYAPTLRYVLLAVLVLLVDGMVVVFFAWRDQRRKNAAKYTMTITGGKELF